MRAELWTTRWCPYCVRALALLERHGIEYVEHAMDGKRAELIEVKRRFGHPTVPIILLDGTFIGGCEELEALDRAGRLGSASAS